MDGVAYCIPANVGDNVDNDGDGVDVVGGEDDDDEKEDCIGDVDGVSEGDTVGTLVSGDIDGEIVSSTEIVVSSMMVAKWVAKTTILTSVMAFQWKIPTMLIQYSPRRPPLAFQNMVFFPWWGQ